MPTNILASGGLSLLSMNAYKRQFALWKWYKNLTTKVAGAMAHKARKRSRDHRKDTVFTYGEMEFTTGQAERTLARSKKPRTEIEMSGMCTMSLQSDAFIMATKTHN